jgi:hypothetical protein
MTNNTMVKEKGKNRQIIVDTTLKATTKHGETRTSLVTEFSIISCMSAVFVTRTIIPTTIIIKRYVDIIFI